MKYIAYYYDGYDGEKPIWFDLAVNGLKHYYNKYDVACENLSYKNNDLLRGFVSTVGKNWWSMMTSRLLYVPVFLKTDYDMMIVTDLDYVVLRSDINVLNYLDYDAVIPHAGYINHKWCPKDVDNGIHNHVHNKVSLYNTMISGASDDFYGDKNLANLSCDWFALSRKACIDINEFFASRGWNLEDPISFSEKYKSTLETIDLHGQGGIVDEGFYGCWMESLRTRETDLSLYIPYNNESNPICSTTWGEYKLDVQNIANQERIFHHFGTLSKSKPDELYRLMRLFQKC